MPAARPPQNADLAGRLADRCRGSAARSRRRPFRTADPRRRLRGDADSRTLAAMPGPTTIDAVVARALEAYEALTSLGEDVEDEWSYVNDLSSTWRDRLDAVVATRGGTAVEPAVAAAIDAACAEVARLTDPHRAIDWLSTFPQVVLLALGERP